ncbi:MAG: hypothetical protein NWE93_12905 [Candidatus Bathyarchaeota archaeon]|nr:hypothetical protein [Candidatus Bathyarchaeota archaeon]
MKRVNLFLILLITAIAALIVATAIGFAVFSTQQNPTGWMGQMWGGNASSSVNGHGSMMNHNGATQTPTATAAASWLPYFGVLFAVIIGITILSVIGVTYYLVYPQIRIGAAPQPPATLTGAVGNGGLAYESVSKTLTDEERQVIEVLKAHDGKYLQKYIKAETGLSRLKTHRILARLSERGMVSLEKVGNTNQVTLAEWLNQTA